MRLLLLLLFPIMLFSQQQQIDTVKFDDGKLYALRYISIMPPDSALSQSDRFMRGISMRNNLNPTEWKRLDSIVVFNQAGERQIQNEQNWGRKIYNTKTVEESLNLPGSTVRGNVYLAGRVGEVSEHNIDIRNGALEERRLKRFDEISIVQFSSNELRLPPKETSTFLARTEVPPGSTTALLEWRNVDRSDNLELTFVLLGYDLMEDDFRADRQKAKSSPWLVPEGREVLYLRLESTEKLMTIYREGRPFKKVAVGRQLDEVSLLALPKGDFMLEVVDLRTREKRYHGIRR